MDELCSRLVAAIFTVAILSLLEEMSLLAGSNGVRPCRMNVDAAQRDFSPTTLWLFFPSSLHISGASDAALQGTAWVGLIASLLAALLPRRMWALRSFGFLAAHAAFGSFGLCDALIIGTPWDCMLLEAAPIEALAAYAHGKRSRSLARDASGWLRRWLLIRVLVGFAKVRFLDTTHTWPYISWLHAWPGSLDGAYNLRNFMLMVPMTQRLGYFMAATLPDAVFRLGHCFYVAVESEPLS